MNVSSDLPIAERGICWGTNRNPTIFDNKTASGNRTGAFIGAKMTNLTLGEKYFVKAYAICSEGVFYGNEISFTANYGEGEKVLSGIICYILQPRDEGYVEGETHGYVVTEKNLSKSANWSTAVSLCMGSTVGGFNDWHLPKKEELQKFYLHTVFDALEGRNTDYWSSTEYNATEAYTFQFLNGYLLHYQKTLLRRVKAIRKF